MSTAIRIENFSYKYSDSFSALSDINLGIGHGEKVAIIGPNGAGKSTLLLAMNYFLKGNGRIDIDGVELSSKNIKSIRTKIGLVLQNPDEQLFMPTLFEDIAFGPLNMGLTQPEIIDRTETTLKTVGLQGLGNRPPYHLSAGQKRAAAIATILSMNPKIITMDEPDTSLDPRNRKKLTALLTSLEQTLIIATCNMNFAATLCTRIVLMDAGTIVADGPPKKIMTNRPLMENHGLEIPNAFQLPPVR